MYDDEWLNKVFLPENLAKLTPDEIKRIFLHDIRMFYSPIEAAIELAVDLDKDRVQEREMVFDVMKRATEKIDKYVDHIQSYLKARDDMKRADGEGG